MKKSSQLSSPISTVSGYFKVRYSKAFKHSHFYLYLEGNQNQPEHHEEELNSEDLLLPWSCCVAQFLAAEEEKERKLNEPQTLANTIRHRLMAKNQVSYGKRLASKTFVRFSG